MALRIAKKGVAFTLISLVFLTLVFFSLESEKDYSLRQESSVVGSRVRATDFFIYDLERDIERGTYIAGFRSLLGLQQYITSTGRYINNTPETLQEILVYGTINGSYVSVMNETQLTVWIERIKHEAAKIAVDLEYTINDVQAYHTDPWVVGIELNVSLNISDRTGVASWDRDQLIATQINITTFEDPIYTVSTYGRVINTIQATNVTDFTDGTDTANLLYHLDNSLYIESESAPSYLMRLSGNLSNSTYGIESLVNLKELEDMLLDPKNKTCIDYYYFSNETPADYFINHTYNWFRLDNESGHLETYEAGHLI